MPAPGNENDQERREADVNGRVISYSHLCSDVGVAVWSGSSQDGNSANGKKVERNYPSPSTTLVLHSGTPDSMQTQLFWLLPLIVPPDNVDTSVIPDCVAVVPHPNESARRRAAVDKNNPNRKSNTFTMAKLLLCGVRDSADAFSPLKSIAGGLCFILENYKVQPSSISIVCSAYGCPQQTEANKQVIELLAPRLKVLAELLCVPIPEGDIEEQERRERFGQ